MNKSAQPDGTENKLKWIHSDGFLSDFCCGNLILLRNRFYGYSFLFWLYVNSWGNPKNEIEIFNKWQKIKLSLVFAIDRQTYAKYDCGNA